MGLIGGNLLLEKDEKDEKEVEEMGKPFGTCNNCLREGMKISNARGDGLCGSCQSAIMGLKGEARIAALAEAKEKFMGKPKLAGGKKQTKRTDEFKMGNVIPTILTTQLEESERNIKYPKAEDLSICRENFMPPSLMFMRDEVNLHVELISERDHKLADGLTQLAERERRTVSAQILHMLEDVVRIALQEERGQP